MCVCVCNDHQLKLYIYIRELVVTKSLCGYVSNQVQYSICKKLHETQGRILYSMN